MVKSCWLGDFDHELCGLVRRTFERRDDCFAVVVGMADGGVRFVYYSRRRHVWQRQRGSGFHVTQWRLASPLFGVVLFHPLVM